jgi:hypothetical protein
LRIGGGGVIIFPLVCKRGAGGIEEGLVFRAEDYLYSIAADYAGENGIFEKVIVV